MMDLEDQNGRAASHPPWRTGGARVGGAVFVGATLAFLATLTARGSLTRVNRRPSTAELEESLKAAASGHLPTIRELRDNITLQQYMRDQFHGRWCEAVQFDPHYGVIDLSDICPNELNLSVGNFSFPAVDPELGRQQFASVRTYLDRHPTDEHIELYTEALEDLKGLDKFRIEDIFAFRETWSDQDTELLQRLDPMAGGFAPGVLSTEAFAAKLPSVDDLRRLVSDDRMAIVGGGDSLSVAGLGPEIDSHPHVVRFNEIVGDRLVPPETGTKTSIHVSCSKVRPLRNSSIAEFDLETDTVWRTWCGRMHSGGEFASMTDRPFLIRPSAYCVLSRDHAKLWTRGFLFYWFIGRLFKEVHLYGFSGHGHYNNSQPLYEKYLDFEHLFYRVNNLLIS